MSSDENRHVLRIVYALGGERELRGIDRIAIDHAHIAYRVGEVSARLAVALLELHDGEGNVWRWRAAPGDFIRQFAMSFGRPF